MLVDVASYRVMVLILQAVSAYRSMHLSRSIYKCIDASDSISFSPSLLLVISGQRNISWKLNFYFEKSHCWFRKDVFCSGVISPDSAVPKQHSQTPCLIAVWHLSAGVVDVKDRKLLFTLDSFALSASHILSKWRKTQPLLEQNVLVETTDLPNFKHLLIKGMPRKQGLFFLISIETLSHASFLTHCRHFSMHQQALLAGPAFFRQRYVWNMQGRFFF